MKSFDSEFKKHAEKTRLSVSEKRDLRERVSLYMEYHPLANKSVQKKTTFADAIPFESFSILKINTRVFQVAGGFFAVMLVVIPLAAQRSVPGDVLYLVKTDITEPIQAQFSNSPYEKIEFETRLMERRIAEARTLEKKGRLTDEVRSDIAVTVKSHSDAVQTGIAELRTQDAEGAAIAQIAYSSSLDVQSAMLDKGAPQANGRAMAVSMMAMSADMEEATPIDPILSVLNSARDEVANNQGDVIPSFESLTARLEIETTRAYELFEVVKKSATAEEVANIERRFSDINRLTSEAQKARDESEFVAVEQIKHVLKQTQKLILFMTDIDVRENVALEVIVPIVLSVDERMAIAQAEYADLEIVRNAIQEQLLSNTDPDIMSKVEEGMQIIDELMLTISDQLTPDNIDFVEFSLQDARMFIDDVQAILMVIPTDIEIGVEISTDEEAGTSTDEVIEVQILQ